MSPEGSERRLAAIMFTDIVGYTALMAESEEKGLRVRARHRELVRPLVERYRGESIEARGDESLSTFPTALDAVNCALAIQEQLRDDPELQLHLGIHLGDIVVRGGEISGDGVNIASRICSLSEGGVLCASGEVYQSVRNQSNIEAVPLGEHELRNVGRPVSVFAIGRPGTLSPGLRLPARRAIAVPSLSLIAGLAVMLALAGALAWLLVQAPDESSSTADPVLTLLDGPSIAVLPFANISGDPEQEYFGDGLTEDIITELSRFRELFVIARNSTLQYKGRAVDIKQVGRDLGVRYVLEGSVRRDADTIRVTAQLVDAGNGAHLWAETYDRDLTVDSIFGVQDDITEQVVATLAGSYGVISRAGQVRAREKGTDNLNAYDCVLRSYEYELLHTPEAHLRARDCLERAVELDPSYVDAWAQLAYLYREEFFHGFNPRPDSLDRALELAGHAVELDATNQLAHFVLAITHFARKELDPFFAEAERAFALNPNNARVVGGLGLNMALAGRWDRGVELSRKAAALNPHHPWWLHLTLSFDHYRKGEYEEALAEAQKISVRNLPIVHANLAATYGQLGREDEARGALADLLRQDPDFSKHPRDELGKFFASEDLINHVQDGLRKAGLEE